VRMAIAGAAAADLAAPLAKLAGCAAVFIALMLVYALLKARRSRKTPALGAEAAQSA